jgi:nitroimidazol reductase NimA-like FMN-containing flavoprotein (pyridoxamine 5'-phosphate oxidase superfamily)
MLVKLPTMTPTEITALLQDQILCRIAFKGANYPYIAPFQYVYMDHKLYFHFTDYGRKMKLLKQDNRVCVEIEKFEPDLSDYVFISLRGTLEVVEDSEERRRIIQRMAEDGKNKLSPRFLAAHGLKKEAGWSSFTAEQPFVIVKLNPIEVIGIRSP